MPTTTPRTNNSVASMLPPGWQLSIAVWAAGTIPGMERGSRMYLATDFPVGAGFQQPHPAPAKPSPPAAFHPTIVQHIVYPHAPGVVAGRLGSGVARIGRWKPVRTGWMHSPTPVRAAWT